MMKKFSSVALISISVFTLISCREKTISIPIHATSPEIIFTIPATPIAGTVATPEVSVPNILDSVIAASGIPMDNIQSVVLNSADMVIDTPATANFDPFDALSIWFRTTATDSVQVFNVTNIPHTQLTSLTSQGNGTDFFSLVKSPQLMVRSRVTTSSPIPQTMTIKMKIHFTVTAQKTI